MRRRSDDDVQPLNILLVRKFMQCDCNGDGGVMVMET